VDNPSSFHGFSLDFSSNIWFINGKKISKLPDTWLGIMQRFYVLSCCNVYERLCLFVIKKVNLGKLYKPLRMEKHVITISVVVAIVSVGEGTYLYYYSTIPKNEPNLPNLAEESAVFLEPNTRVISESKVVNKTMFVSYSKSTIVQDVKTLVNPVVINSSLVSVNSKSIGIC